MKLLNISAIVMFCVACSSPQTEKIDSLSRAFDGKFTIGAAIDTSIVNGLRPQADSLVKKHFNSIVAENCMKCMYMHPAENQYFFDDADRFVDYGERNNMEIIGHCLVWHSQMAPWFCYDDKGELVEPEVLRQRIVDHVTTIVSRYKGRVKGWDVVNEVVVEGGELRDSPLSKIMGEEFIYTAFEAAHAADPDAQLYLNDYGMDNAGRRDSYVRIIRELKNRGLRIDAIGMQGHLGMEYPDVAEFEKSLEAYAAEGVKVMISELDMSALPYISRSANVGDTVAFMKKLNPYPEQLPDSVANIWNDRMATFFNIFDEHSADVQRVTAWGVDDGYSWKNDFPMKGRKEYPLLFDRNFQPKPFIRDIINRANEAKN